MAKRGLGRGLEALFSAGEEGLVQVRELPLESIEVSSHQPRREFAEEKLSELAASIQEHGVLQPIVVRELGNGRFQLIAGERRWRACKALGKERIPAVVREVSEIEARAISLVENLQRDDLSPLEEAGVYRELTEEFGLTQEELARKVGKSRSHVANILRLLSLPPSLQELLHQRQLTVGHAKAILSLPDPGQREELGKLAAEKGLTVRDTEELVRRMLSAQICGDAAGAEGEIAAAGEPQGEEAGETAREGEEDVRRLLSSRLEALWQEVFGLRARVKWRGTEKGVLEIPFRSVEELNRLEKLLSSSR